MWIKRLVVMIAFLPLLGTGAWGVDKPAEDRRRVAPTGGYTPPVPERVSAEGATEPNSLVAVKAGRLHVQVRNMSLGSLMRAIARQSGVQIITDERVARKVVSIQLQEVPLDQGLLHILQGLDTFFLYGATGERTPASTALKGLWIYPQGHGERLAPVPPEQWASSQELEQGLNDPEETERARTVELMVERKGPRALDDVLLALEDGEDQVRERALHVALYAGMPLPLPRLEELAQYDPSPLVRFLALGAIVRHAGEAAPDNPYHRALVEHALDDPSPEVREQARQILQQWEDPGPSLTTEEEQQGETEPAERESK